MPLTYRPKAFFTARESGNGGGHIQLIKPPVGRVQQRGETHPEEIRDLQKSSRAVQNPKKTDHPYDVDPKQYNFKQGEAHRVIIEKNETPCKVEC